MTKNSLTNLPALTAGLSPKNQQLFFRIYSFYKVMAAVRVPPERRDWICSRFGETAKVESQEIIKIFNKIEKTGILFNPIRAKRPNTKVQNKNLLQEITDQKECAFCRPESLSFAETFPNILGKFCCTTANIAKYDKWHSMVVFKKHNPLLWQEEWLIDYFKVAREWFRTVQETSQKTIYPLLIWNNLWKAGASITHGHLQVLASEDEPYVQACKYQALCKKYHQKYQASYFDDLFQVHSALGLGCHLPVSASDTKVLVPLVGKKEQEVMVIADEFGDSLARLVHKLLLVYREQLQVKSFNLVIYLPPLPVASFGRKNYLAPVVLRLISRGDLNSSNPEIASMERLVQEVVTADPFLVAKAVLQGLRRN